MYHGSTCTSVMCQTKKEGAAETAETAEASSAAAQQSAAERERSELSIVRQLLCQRRAPALLP